MRQHIKHVKHGFFHGLLPLLYIAIGFYGGAKFDAPDPLIRTIDGVVIRAHGVAMTLIGHGTDYAAGTTEDLLRDMADKIAKHRTGDESEPVAVALTETSAPKPTLETEKKFVHAPESQTLASSKDLAAEPIQLCMTNISNAPRADANGLVAPGDKVISYKGAELLLMPATNACLSSGYGSRNGRSHNGIDYYSKTGGQVLAADDGVIIEAVTRSDYGNMVVIDHGDGVFTRYAHLGRFASGVREGVEVRRGQILGPIGNTGATSVTHLHYEVLTGNYDDRAKSFGLTSENPFSL